MSGLGHPVSQPVVPHYGGGRQRRICTRAGDGNQGMNLRIFGGSYAVTVLALIAAFFYGGVEGLVLCAILGILEVSLSFDNAVVNATVLERMDAFWQRIFLTVGIVIAVFGMRLLFPLLIVGITADINPIQALTLALEQRPASDPTSYAHLLDEAYPQIASFG